MEIRCPACQRPIELKQLEAAGDSPDVLHTITRVACPDCGLVQISEELDETATFESGHDRQRGVRVAHFSLVRLLGRGAYGEVWLADDTVLERQVALKLPVAKGDDTANLMREAQTAAHLRHPSIVSVYEVGSETGQVFIASEYIEGLTLHDLLSAGTPAIANTVELMRAVAEALHHAHQQEVVHRDIKPSNILINAQGQPFVTDFGIAKRISTRETISSEGQIVGTARYMSPEQAVGRSRQTDHRADIYSIGVILFEMLTGNVPFRGNMRAILHQKVVDDAPSPRRFAPTLPKDLETICLKCLEREPGKRFQSADELADELKRFSAGEPIKSRPISAIERGWRWCKRRPAVAGLLAGLILSLSAGLLGVSFFYWEAVDSAELAHRSLYRSQMNLAAEYLAKGDIAGVRQTVDRVESDERLSRLRGFEWRYYDKLTEPFVQVVNQGDVVGDVAISPGGDLFASVGTEREIRIWQTKTGTLIRSLSLDAGRFRAIVFSPNGAQLASGSSDGVLRVWDPSSDGPPLRQVKHGPPVAVVRYSPDGTQLLSLGSSGAVRLWDAALSLVAEIPAGKSGGLDARFSPDGETLAVAARDGCVRLWDIQTKSITGELSPNPVIESIAYSEDGETVATGSSGGVVRFWSVSGKAQTHTHETFAGPIGGVEFVGGTTLLAMLASDGQLRLYDTVSRQVTRQLYTHTLAYGVLAKSDNGGLLAIGGGDGSIKLLRVDGLARPNLFWHDAHIRGVYFLPGGTELVASSGDGAVRTWDVRSGESRHLADPTGRQIVGISVQPGGKLIAAAGVDPPVVLRDGGSGQIVREINIPGDRIVAVLFSASGRHLAVATQRDGTFIYESVDWTKPPRAIANREAAVQALAFSADGRSVVVGYEDGEVHFVNTADGTARAAPIIVSSIPQALAFCESDRLLAIGTDGGEIHLYDVVSRHTRSVIKGHTSRINALAVFPNGTTLVSGGRERELKLWDTVSGELLTKLAGHYRQVFAIAVSPDGNTIASGGLEGDIRLWRADPGR